MKTQIFIILFFVSIFATAQEKPVSDSIKTKEIQEVVISKKVFKQEADRLVYDVASSPVAKGNTTFDLLKQIPLVSSTDDQNLKIAGKNNVIIYIDGRRTQMNATALESFLKSTPGENIKKIEVITTPGSEFNVESSDGIINIVLKKRRDEGINGNMRLSNTQAKRNSQTSSVSANFRKGKLGGNANLNYNNNMRDQSFVLRNGNLGTDTEIFNMNTSIGDVATQTQNLGGYLNLDYELGEKQNVALSYNAWRSKLPDMSANFHNKIEIENNSNGLDTFYTRSLNSGNSKDLNQSVNLNYEYKFDDDEGRINFNVAYLNYQKKEFNFNTTYLVTEDNEIIDVASQFRQNTPQNIDSYSSTLDFKKKYKHFTLGAGGNFSKTITDNNALFETFEPNTETYLIDTNQSNHFVYDEKIGGLYLNVEKKFSDKFSAKLGARLEYTDSFGEILDTDITVKRENVNFLPTLNLNYSPAENHSFTYAFTSRVKRPSFWEINPVRIYLTEVNYVQNNPFMKAASVYNQQLMYLYKSTYFLQLQNNFTQDANTQVPLQKLENGINTLRYIRTNYGSHNEFSANLGLNKSFFDQIWSMNLVLGLQVNTFKGVVDQDPITNETLKPFVFDFTLASPLVQTNNTIRLAKNKTWYMGVNYFYFGKSRADLGTLQPIQQLDLSLKKLWNEWTFAFQINDVFKDRLIMIDDLQETGDFNQVDIYQYSRNAVLSITYNFGNQKLKNARKIKSAADDIKDRTGN